MEPIDGHTVVYDPRTGRGYDPAAGSDFLAKRRHPASDAEPRRPADVPMPEPPPRPLYPPPPEPPPEPEAVQEYDPAAVMAALYPETFRAKRARLDEEITVIVTYLEPEGWHGSPWWQVARMRRGTYETLREGGQIDPGAIIFEGRATEIYRGGPNVSAMTDVVKKREKQEVKRIAKLYGMPYLLRYRTKTVSRTYGELRSSKKPE